LRMADLSRRKFLRFLAAAPVVAPALAKVLPAPKPTLTYADPSSITITRCANIEIRKGISFPPDDWAGMLLDVDGQVMWVWAGDAWKKVAVT
jgi:hypothetical protein